jgi:hypothetical protein
MTGFAFRLTYAHLPSRGFDRRGQARAALGQRPDRRISVVPFALVAAVLLAANIWIATRLQGERERAFMFAAIGAAGMPIFQTSPSICGSPSGRASAVKLDRAEMLSLLAGN